MLSQYSLASLFRCVMAEKFELKSWIQVCVKDAMRLQAADCFLCCSFTVLNDTIPIICYKTGVATKQASPCITMSFSNYKPEQIGYRTVMFLQTLSKLNKNVPSYIWLNYA